MNILPNPLHPALVHFPIVLILLGAVTAIVAVFLRRRHLAIWTALLLSLGSIGCWVAMETGETDEHRVEESAATARNLLEEHEEWAERTFVGSVCAAVVAIVSVALMRFPKLSRAGALFVAIAGLVSSYSVFRTGHQGGALVYEHGAGVGPITGSTSLPGTPPRALDSD